MVSAKSKNNKIVNHGFTIVELVIVITVIAILASIIIVGFGSWRTRVAQTEVKSDIDSFQAGMEDARNRTDTYPIFTSNTEFNGSATTRGVFTQSKNVRVIYARGTATTYCVNVQSLVVTSVMMFVDTAATNKNPQNGTC